MSDVWLLFPTLQVEQNGGMASPSSMQQGTATTTTDTQKETVCAADALVSSGWQAFEDSDQRKVADTLAQEDDEDDPRSLQFRKTQSMRATSHRKVQIVDALKQQRRLSASSLDRAPGAMAGLFSNEDELSRRYNMEREWQLFVKMNRRVPGTRSVVNKYLIIILKES